MVNDKNQTNPGQFQISDDMISISVVKPGQRIESLPSKPERKQIDGKQQVEQQNLLSEGQETKTVEATYYKLEYHPTTIPIPIGIWEMQDGRHYRCVAILKGDAEATYEEAQIMLRALQNGK